MRKKFLYSAVFTLLVVIALSAFNLSSIALSATDQTRANWWDSMFGTPKYGGTINIGASDISTGSFDPYNWMNVVQVHIYDPLWIIDPTLDRTKVDLTCDWVINTNYKGHIAQSYSIFGYFGIYRIDDRVKVRQFFPGFLEYNVKRYRGCTRR